MFAVALDGEAELERAWGEVVRSLSDGCRRGVELAAREGAAEARARHAYKDRTGELTRSIDGVVEVTVLGGAYGYIRAGAEYASFVEEGTAPHTIRPLDYHWGEGRFFHGPATPWSRSTGREAKGVKPGVGRGQALRWIDDGGEVRFARVVHHPGTRPYPFMGIAYQKAERVLERELGIATELAAALLAR